MRIVFEKMVLADHGTESVQGYLDGIAMSPQVVSPLRARFVTLYARANKKNDISFRVTRLHKTVDEAENFISEHPQEVPEIGMLTVETSNRKSKRYFRGALVIAQCSHIGCSSFTSYQIIGTEIKIVKPL